MRRHVRSPITWVGGKSRLVDWLLPHLSVPCRVYCEPFGGSASVLLNRDRVEVEVYNDLDQALVTFMLCCREHPGELERLVAGLPYSRVHHHAEAAWFKLGCPGRMTDLQFASRWWWLNLAGFGGQIDAGFGVSVTESHAGKMDRRILTIHEASRRLRDVVIECADVRVILDRYDTPETLFYLDPPYVGAEGVYDEGGFSERDHRDLGARLAAVQGKAVVSYYPCALVDEIYPADRWRRETKQRASTLANFRDAPDAETHVTELLLLNYDPPTQRSLGLL
jgi:DNA adenine methylase